MKITITNGPVVDTVEVDPNERKQLAERATAALRVRGSDREVSPDEIPIGQVNTYALIYEHGETYEVDPEVGGRFKSRGWAVSAPENAKIPRGRKPFDAREATEEDAEKWEAEGPARHEAAKRRQAGIQEPDLDVQDATSENGASF